MTRIVKNEGMRAILPCNPPNSNPPGHIEWDRQRKVLQLGSSHFSKSLDGDLYFAYTKSTDRGTYRCDIDNDRLGQYRSKKFVLEVRSSKLIILTFCSLSWLVLLFLFLLAFLAFSRCLSLLLEFYLVSFRFFSPLLIASFRFFSLFFAFSRFFLLLLAFLRFFLLPLSFLS